MFDLTTADSADTAVIPASSLSKYNCEHAQLNFLLDDMKFTEADWKVIMHNGSDQRRKIVNPSLEFLETCYRYSQGFTGNGVAIINGSNSHNK